MTDTDALTERIARALYENAEYYGPEDVQPAWEHRDDEERDEWREIAAAVLPTVAEEVRKAKAAEERADRAEARYAPARRVVRAWTDAGPYPAVHRNAQRLVQRHMPVLARQLDALARRFPEW